MLTNFSKSERLSKTRDGKFRRTHENSNEIYLSAFTMSDQLFVLPVVLVLVILFGFLGFLLGSVT
jgi:hypothetical protein